MKVLILSAHPDDAETAAGGFAARNVQGGHEVVILHGGPAVREMGYKDRLSWDVRREESEAAAEELGARVAFLDWSHSEFEFNRATAAQLNEFVAGEDPDLVVAHWPIDTHPDHQVIGALAQSLFIRQRRWRLAFFEVYAGIQTLEFEPNRYIDITDVIERKNASILCHISQDPEPQVEMHEKMSRFRGLEFGVAHAEAFRLMGGSGHDPCDVMFDPPRWYGTSGGISE